MCGETRQAILTAAHTVLDEGKGWKEPKRSPFNNLS